jgi:hypothetical protein
MKHLIAFLLGLSLLAIDSNAQVNEINCSGYVYDSVGMSPLVNVNVSVAGSKVGTITNRDGYFKLKLPAPHSVLIFSYMGYGIRQYAVDEAVVMPIKILMITEVRNIGEVTVFNNKFRNILEGDSLQVLDYEIWNNRLLILARSANDSLKQRIYLTNLGGYIYSYRNLHDMGKNIKFPDEPRPQKIYLFKDTYGEIQLLAKTRVWQIFLKEDKIYLIYPSKYEDCGKYLFPIKCRLNDKLFFQESDLNNNNTYFIVRNTDTIKRVKHVYDEFGNMRYLKQRNVRVPIISYRNQMVLFNFFANELEFFNDKGRSVRKVKTMFHTMWYYDVHGKKAYDLDVVNFTQDIIVDDKTGKVFTIWRTALTGRYTLKELDLDTGEIVREIQIPDHPFIDKVLVHNNQVWFMFRDRQEQKYKSLYTMFMN